MRSVLLIPVLLLVAAPAARTVPAAPATPAAEAVPAAGAAPARDHEVALEDYFSIAWVSDLAMSPDGKRVAYVEQRWEDADAPRNADLWVVDAEGALTRLTFDPESDDTPAWGPDGRWIYLLTSRKRPDETSPPYDGTKQVWRVSPEGGEIFPVTRFEDGVSEFELARDGKTLYVRTKQEHVDEDDWKALREDFKKITYGHGVTEFSQLWTLDLETWRSEKILDERRVIIDFAVSPDGRRIAMLTKPDDTLLTGEGWSRVDVLDTRTDAVATLPDRLWREEAPSPYGWLVAPTWSDDSRALAFRVDFDGYPGEVFFAFFDQGEDPVVRKMTRPGEVTVEDPMLWMPGSRTFCFLAVDHARARVMALSEVTAAGAGASRILTPGDVVVEGASFGRAAEDLAVIIPGLDHPSDVFRVENAGPKARYERLTRSNPQVDAWKIPRIRTYAWTAPDGTTVEGILELPPDWEPSKGPLPLVVSIHGGPTSSSLYAFRFYLGGQTLFASRGWALFDPNYRGSTGYGDRFLTDLIGRENDIEVKDILSGVDALITEGIADSSRMAVMGWSNGGYLTNCIIARDRRFKAASSGAGVFDMAMQWSIEDTPGHVINYMRGLPWEEAEEMRRSSPLYQADKITTPTLIHVGEKDERVPPEHSRGLYRALKHYLNVPTELVVYPGAGHGLTTYSHRKAKLSWDVRWLDHHVLGKPGEEME